MLFAHLGEGSSAPLVREKPVTDECLAALIQSNMRLFDAHAHFVPRTVEIYVSITNIGPLLAWLRSSANTQYDRRETFGPQFRISREAYHTTIHVRPLGKYLVPKTLPKF